MDQSASDDIPLYRQVKDHILERILAGDWAAGARVPSENELTRDLGVSRMTVNRALRELTGDGWLLRVQGAGTFVAEQKPQSALLEIRNIRDEIMERGHEHSCDVIELRRERASADVAKALGLRHGQVVYHSVLLHRENGSPVQIEDRQVNPNFAPDYMDQDFTRITPYEYLSDIGPLDAAEHLIEAVCSEKAICKLLGVSASEPCLRVTRRTWSSGIVVSRARLTYPGSRYRLAGYQDYLEK